MTEASGGQSVLNRDTLRVAIVTGGAGEGIGHGITSALARHGWAVLIVDRDISAAKILQETLAREGYSISFLEIDISTDDAPSKALECALSLYGRLDGLVNNAGIGLCKPANEIEDDELDRILDVDFRSAFRFCRAALPALLRNGGAIVNIGSIHAHATIRGYAAYAAAKGAIEAFTRGLAADYGAYMVRVNCISPGLVMSPQNRDLISRFTDDVDAWLEAYTRTKQLIPVLPTAQQVGELASFLMSKYAQAITGQTFTIDGGTSVMLYELEPHNKPG